MREPARRPLSLRSHPVFQRLARWMSEVGMSPNVVSLASVVFIGVGAVVLVVGSRLGRTAGAVSLFAFPLFVLLRSICNLIDGMIAVEGGKRTASGELFNDFPDRVSDPLMFIAAGYAACEPRWGVPLGWSAALFSLIVAYVRMLGGAAGASQSFIGPMAKTHRMSVLSMSCIAAGFERMWAGSTWSLNIGMEIVIAGCVVTIVRRLHRIVRELEAQ